MMGKKNVLVCICMVMAVSLSCNKENTSAGPYPSRTLYLVRHATAQHADSLTLDFERLLDPQGRQEALNMGIHLKGKIHTPSLVVMSPAKRVLETTEILCDELSYSWADVQTDSSLYMCSPETLLNVIRHLDNEHHSVMIVGHNPATGHVAGTLQSTRYIDHLPPMGVVAIQFTVSQWGDISITNSRLLFYTQPDEIN